MQVSSDAGILPLRQFDHQIGYTDRFIGCLNEVRDPDRIEHSLPELVRQLFYGLPAGYEDCNDHDTLRSDPIFKMVGSRKPDDDDLASQQTLSQAGGWPTPLCVKHTAGEGTGTTRSPASGPTLRRRVGASRDRRPRVSVGCYGVLSLRASGGACSSTVMSSKALPLRRMPWITKSRIAATA